MFFSICTVGYRTINISANETTQIVSPNHPGINPPDIDITWVIQTDEEQKILVTFTHFNTWNRADYLRAGDGVNSAGNTGIFFQWTGSWNFQTPDLLSSGNKMWLKFTAHTHYSNRNGFALSALSVPTTGMSFICTYIANHLFCLL